MTAARTASAADLLAGLSIAGLLLPEAVAYSQLAGLAPQAGVIALFAGLICYGLIGRSRFAIVSATSSSAAVLASAMLALGVSGAAERAAVASLLVVGAGVAFALCGALKLGAMSNLIARPVLHGYAFGLALVIAVKQWPTIAGIHTGESGFFALLAEVWYNHYRFFRRYGLQTSWAVFLNCALLFFVLFYVYPLKFLFVMIFQRGGLIEVHEARVLFVVYGLGYAAVFAALALMYRDAWKKRAALALDEVELLKTRQSLTDHAAMVVVGLTSTALALLLPDRLVGFAGYWYLLIGVYFTASGTILGKRVRELVEKLKREEKPSNAPE
jgi:MFS superfamily sulfate permease-like transporter